jgi:hypothetical protein
VDEVVKDPQFLEGLQQQVQLVLKTPSLDQTLATAVAVAVAVGIQLAELVVQAAAVLVHPSRVWVLMAQQTPVAVVAVVPQDVCSAAKVEVDVSSCALQIHQPLLLNPQRPARLAANHTHSV